MVRWPLHHNIILQNLVHYIEVINRSVDINLEVFCDTEPITSKVQELSSKDSKERMPVRYQF